MMTMRVEWDQASNVAIAVLSAEAATESLHPDDGVDAPFVLLIGGWTGGAFAIEGDLAGFREIAQRILAATDAQGVAGTMGDDACCGWFTGVPGTLAMNETEIERCDDCAVFATDEDAARAVAAAGTDRLASRTSVPDGFGGTRSVWEVLNEHGGEPINWARTPATATEAKA